ncbi:hypothetical protein GCM10009830_30440 [Glycomyces endophyticus]|uniref:Phosphoribosyltransferase domain-containing protein n=1 Tax=Glycomyces endophyticus TaxID=480996 RepID=A0ABN2H4M7_9ACTN
MSEPAHPATMRPGPLLEVRPPWADRLYQDFAAPCDLAVAASHTDRLAARLLHAVSARCTDAGRPAAPVVVMRGGMLMLPAARRACVGAPWGFVLARRRAGEVVIERADLPKPHPGTTTLLLDTVVNTGDTIVAVLQELERRGAAPGSAALACVFLTERGEARIRARFPLLPIATVWSGLEVGADGWVSGIGFDAGDCAVGGGSRLQWP